MPIVILIDVSLSMSRPINTQDSGKVQTRYTAAVAGINAILDHLTANNKLEFVCLIAFSSLYEVVCDFTRDYEAIKQRLGTQDDFDKTCIEDALHGTYLHVLNEWGHQTHTHIILVTDGCVSSITGTNVALPVPSFPCTLHVMTIASSNEPLLPIATALYRKLIDKAASNATAPNGSINVPEAPFNLNSVVSMFKKLCTDHLSAWRGVLKCGSLEGRITLSPPPIPHTHVTDFDTINLCMSNVLEICGFLAMQDIASPMALSRHLILPLPPTSKEVMEASPSATDEDNSDTGRVPNLCVLLHGALKVESSAGLVKLGPDWYGFVHSWADSKKKSNLMLSALPPGDDTVPWLGQLDQLGIAEAGDLESGFPVRASERRSYAAAGAVWVRPAGLQADLHKLLRHARKLPEKTHHFNKEVNRVRRAALALGWVEALEAAAIVLEREATVLPPAAAAPIAIAVRHLRECLDPKMQLPL